MTTYPPNATFPPSRPAQQVLLGASGVLSNGTVVSRAGSAAVAMMAAADSTPVLICCETYKFHERVQLDSITHNELGDPDALASTPGRVAGPLAGGPHALIFLFSCLICCRSCVSDHAQRAGRSGSAVKHAPCVQLHAAPYGVIAVLLLVSVGDVVPAHSGAFDL